MKQRYRAAFIASLDDMPSDMENRPDDVTYNYVIGPNLKNVISQACLLDVNSEAYHITRQEYQVISKDDPFYKWVDIDIYSMDGTLNYSLDDE